MSQSGYSEFLPKFKLPDSSFSLPYQVTRQYGYELFVKWNVIRKQMTRCIANAQFDNWFRLTATDSEIETTTAIMVTLNKTTFFFFLVIPYAFFRCRIFFLLMDPFRHLVGLLGREISPALRPLPTHRTTQTHIHAPSRIRTCDLNVRADEDSTCNKTTKGH
jgi:hypothetical protein